MLKTRILTALVLLAVFIPAALFLPDLGWAILMSALIGVAAWEWAGLAGFGKKGRIAYGLVLFGILAAFSLYERWLWELDRLSDGQLWRSQRSELLLSILCCLFWFVVVPLWLRFRWSLRGVTGLVVGLFALVPAWFTVIVMTISYPDTIFPGLSDKYYPNIKPLLFIFAAIAWIADIVAYFIDRKFGRHKLAPSISPGKTWEGAAGAFVAVFLYLYLLVETFAVERLFFSMTLCFAFVATAACILGDLFASLLKRQAGVKYSSNLIGVLDRIDSVLALLAVCPVLMWILVVMLDSYGLLP